MHTLSHSNLVSSDALSGRLVLGATILWGVSISMLSYMGVFTAMPLPVFAFIVAALVTGLTVYYLRSVPLQKFVVSFGLRKLTLLHVWRIPAALAFFYYGADGGLPETFVMLAGWGDMLAGVLALIVVLFFSRNAKAYWAMHIIGLADFLVAVGTGQTFALLQDPSMVTIAAFPLALIPLFGVAISGVTHIMAFRMLASERVPY